MLNANTPYRERRIIETRALRKEFKGFVAVNDVSIAVKRGEIHALIGPNGAGKTTFFNLLTKFLPPTAGQILFNGEDITPRSPAQIARRGIVRSFQISAVFPHLTVLENVRVALAAQSRHVVLFLEAASARSTLLNDRAMDLLAEVGLRLSPTRRPSNSRTGASARSRSRPRSRWSPN